MYLADAPPHTSLRLSTLSEATHNPWNNTDNMGGRNPAIRLRVCSPHVQPLKAQLMNAVNILTLFGADWGSTGMLLAISTMAFLNPIEGFLFFYKRSRHMQGIHLHDVWCDPTTGRANWWFRRSPGWLDGSTRLFLGKLSKAASIYCHQDKCTNSGEWECRENAMLRYAQLKCLIREVGIALALSFRYRGRGRLPRG